MKEDKRCPGLPSGQHAESLVQGDWTVVGPMLGDLLVRAGIIGVGLYAAGQREQLVRSSLAGATAVELAVVGWTLATCGPESPTPLEAVGELGEAAVEQKLAEHVDQLPGGLADRYGKGGPPHQPSPSQVQRGIAVEMEHTSDPKLALEIALDHLAEHPDYYTRLEAVDPH